MNAVGFCTSTLGRSSALREPPEVTRTVKGLKSVSLGKHFKEPKVSGWRGVGRRQEGAREHGRSLGISEELS